MRLSPALFLALGLAHPSAAQPSLPAVDAYVAREMRANRLPGVAVAVVRGGRVVHLKGYGEAGGGRSVTPGTAFMLGSVSKGFTALAVQQLVEAGRIDVDAPVRRYLPTFALADTAHAARLRVRDLLGHRSGLGQAASYANPREGRTLAERVRDLRTVAPEGPAGADFRYSNANYAVLGAIVEAVSGEPYAAYVERRVFGPLGMTHAFTSGARAEAGGAARGHRFWFGLARPSGLVYPADNLPSGHLMASAADLAQYLAAHLGGASAVLPRAGFDRLRTPAPGTAYAGGWIRGEVGGHPATFHGGALPDWNAFVALIDAPRPGDPPTGVAVLVNANSVAFGDDVRAFEEGVALAAAGFTPPDSGVSLGTKYAAVAFGLALWLAFTARALVRLVRTRRSPALRAALHEKRLATLVGDVGVPIAVALFLPRFTGVGWRAMFDGAPDLVGWLAAALALGLVVGAARLALARPDAVPLPPALPAA